MGTRGGTSGSWVGRMRGSEVRSHPPTSRRRATNVAGSLGHTALQLSRRPQQKSRQDQAGAWTLKPPHLARAAQPLHPSIGSLADRCHNSRLAWTRETARATGPSFDQQIDTSATPLRSWTTCTVTRAQPAPSLRRRLITAIGRFSILAATELPERARTV